MSSYWTVALVAPPYLSLTYVCPDYIPHSWLSPGQRVAVPLSRSLRCGILLEKEGEPTQNKEQIRSILSPLEEEPLLGPFHLRLINEVSRHSLSYPGYVLAQVLPKDLRGLQSSLVREQEEGRESWSISYLQKLDSDSLRRFFWEWQQGQARLRETATKTRSLLVELAANPPWPIRPRASRQRVLLEHLWQEGPTEKQALRRAMGKSADQAMRALKDKGLVRERDPGEEEQASGFEGGEAPGDPLEEMDPTREQKEVFSCLSGDLLQEEFGIRLLHGVTGSGKTLVYMLLARQCLERGRSVLLLVPEIALCLQLWRKVRLSLPGYDCYLYHGHLPTSEKSRVFRELSKRRYPAVVVGTRSAAFLPCTSWGLIVLDEEHDSSFKQEERFPYHAREVAYFLAQNCKALLLLGSATPDLRTYHAACSNHFPLLSMGGRVGEKRLPEVETVDLNKDPPREGPFSERVLSELNSCLERNEQAIVLLNRRGYAPLVYCTGCGRVIHCDYCEVGMTYHKGLERVVCHYCGQSRPFPLACPDCGGHQYVPLLEGTEQIEEYLSSYLNLPSGILRMDRDSTRRKGSMESILDSFANYRARVLVGTQMCSKGHNFPGVSLVTVLDGDIGLNLPDYRATERTFQLLQQVAGRAGRGESLGRVLIQTRSPSHYCWDYIRRNDYHGFYCTEIELRRKRKYPPFVRLALLRLSYPENRSNGEDSVQQVAKWIKERANGRSVQILGPAPAPLRRLRGRIRHQCLIKAADWESIRSLCRPLFSSWRATGGLRISLDLDPVQML